MIARRVHKPVVQRDVNGDLKAAADAVNYHRGLDERVLPPLLDLYPQFTRFAEYINPIYGTFMASGYRAWAENYSNKSKAYVLEAAKALDHTRPSAGVFASLGINTKSDPDISLVQVIDQDTLAGRSLELKSSDSGHDAVAKLVREGLQQLRKRETVANMLKLTYDSHLLVVNMNAPCNYPFTDLEFAQASRSTNMYDWGNYVVQVAWNERLSRKVGPYIIEQGFVRPVEVRMQYQGHRFATYRST